MAAVNPAGPEPTMTTLWTLMSTGAALLGHEGSGSSGCISLGGWSPADEHRRPRVWPSRRASKMYVCWPVRVHRRVRYVPPDSEKLDLPARPSHIVRRAWVL